VSLDSSVRAFIDAVNALRAIDSAFSLYVANDTLYLIRGPLLDDRELPPQDNVILAAASLRREEPIVRSIKDLND